MSKIIRTLLNPFIGKKSFQKLFENIHYVGLLGMNYNNAEFETNGELHLINYLQKETDGQKDLVIFDVGANVGNYTENLLKAFQTQAKIYCFEPSKLTFEKVQERFKNSIQVNCFHAGMGEKEEQLTLYSDKDLSGFASVYQRDLAHHQQTMDMSEEISILALDGFCESNKIDWIDFLKLDVEGHEIAVLKGAEKMLSGKKIKYLQFEFGGCNIDSRTYFRDFWNILHQDYQLYRVAKNGLQPINQYSEKLEVFSYANFFAVMK